MKHINLRRLLYAVADASNGLEIMGAWAKLFAQPFDMGIDGPSLDTWRIAPDALEKRVPRLDTTGPRSEI